MAQRPGTSTRYEGAATATVVYMDVDMNEVRFFVLSLFVSFAVLSASLLEKLWTHPPSKLEAGAARSRPCR
jgi:hypothetical protein